MSLSESIQLLPTEMSLLEYLFLEEGDNNIGNEGCLFLSKSNFQLKELDLGTSIDIKVGITLTGGGVSTWSG